MNSIRFPQSHDFDDFDDEEFAREWAAGRESIGGSAPAEETALEGWVNQPATAGPEGDAGVEQADQWVAGDAGVVGDLRGSVSVSATHPPGSPATRASRGAGAAGTTSSSDQALGPSPGTK